jgi:large subunit ribosomal protein L16
MGKGKGSPDFWACRVKKGQILFEIDGVTSTMAMQAVKAAKYKLPVLTKYISLS